ncbi:alcohol dehydrogenase 2 [Anabrus simplex]|uniref:alcohol dehydrogenase 2 n=1 Tax=Anabrus simplex TaxID=316456 RepID=UPI0035A3BC55
MSGDKKELMDPVCKIAIVTGGATGIGYSACYQLLCEGAAHVVIGGIVPKEGEEAIKKLNEKFGKDKAIFIRCDVTCESEFDNIFKETISRYEHVDILFNNAGMLDDKRWELTVDTNVKGVLRGCFLAFKYMGKDQCGNGGLIVNCASIVGLQPLVGAPVYCCTKHAVIGITRCFGADFHQSRTGIRVCSLCPGVTVTELVTNAHGRQYNDEWGKEATRELNSLPKQTTEMTGKTFTYIVRHGKSGHHYISEDSQTLHADIPDRNCFSTVVASYK